MRTFRRVRSNAGLRGLPYFSPTVVYISTTKWAGVGSSGGGLALCVFMCLINLPTRDYFAHTFYPSVYPKSHNIGRLIHS